MFFTFKPWTGWSVWELVINFIEIFFVFSLFTKTLSLKNGQKNWAILGAVLLFLYISLINSITEIDGTTTTFLSFCGFFCYALFAFNGRRIKRMLFGIIPTTITIISDFLTFAVSIGFNIFDPNRAWDPGFERFMMTSIFIIFAAFLYLTVYIIYKKMHNMIGFSTWMIVFVIILLGLGIIVTNFLYRIGSELMLLGANTFFLDLYVVFIGIAFLVLYISFAFFLQRWGVLLQKNHDIEMQVQYTNMKNDYYSSIQKSFERIGFLQHDFKKHFNAVLMMLNRMDYQQAHDYISKLQGDFTKYLEIWRYTDDDILNAILTSKKDFAVKKGIKVTICAVMTGSFPISAQEVCSLFDNLFENAIEACEKVDGERFIDLHITGTELPIKIVLQNSCYNILVNSDGKLLTTKARRNAHGIGIKIVRDIVERAGGLFDQQYDLVEGIFTTTVILPRTK